MECEWSVNGVRMEWVFVCEVKMVQKKKGFKAKIVVCLVQG